MAPMISEQLITVKEALNFEENLIMTTKLGLNRFSLVMPNDNILWLKDCFTMGAIKFVSEKKK